MKTTSKTDVRTAKTFNALAMKGKGTKVNGADISVSPASTSGGWKNTPDFLRCLQLRFLPIVFCSSILFPTIRWILEGSCSLFEDGILTLQRKTNSLLVKSRNASLFLFVVCISVFIFQPVLIILRSVFTFQLSLWCFSGCHLWLPSKWKHLRTSLTWVDTPFNQGTHSYVVIIGHFRVLLRLCFKTSLSARPFIWKWVLHAVSIWFRT